MTTLSSPPDLIKRTQALAALDLILSPEWQYRYYSFNSVWSASEQMASMRDGCGDEWWIVFHASGWAALKGLAHESQAWAKGRKDLSATIQASFPPELVDFAREPAFRWDATSFAYFFLPSTAHWQRVNDYGQYSSLVAGDDELLRHLIGSPSDYSAFAEDYYETTVPVDIVADIFKHAPISESVVTKLNPEIKFDAITDELYSQIGYPH